MIFCLIGAHRVGKTTLMREACKAVGSKPMLMNVGQIQKELGFDSSNQSYDLDTRLEIQEKVIEKVEEMLKHVGIGDVIMDRSPMDVAAYTLLHAHDKMTPEQDKRLHRIVERCIEVTNKYVMGCLLVQPGIPLVKENDTSAACSSGFIEKLNAICFGLINHGDLMDVPMFYIPRKVTNLEDRVKVLKSAVSRAMLRNVESGRMIRLTQIATDGFHDFFEATDKKQ